MNIALFDQSLFYLGKLCKRNHDWANTGQSLRYLNGPGNCVECYKTRRQENPNREKEYSQKYREQNRNLIREKRLQNIEQELKYARQYWHKNKERLNTLKKEYYRQNKIRFSEYRKSYKQTVSGKLSNKISGQRRRAILRNVFKVKYSLRQLESRFELFDNACAYCGSKEALTLDHFIPLSKKGPDCLENIVPACLSCNCSKNAIDCEEWYSRQPFFSEERWQKILKVLGKTGNVHS